MRLRLVSSAVIIQSARAPSTCAAIIDYAHHCSTAIGGGPGGLSLACCINMHENSSTGGGGASRSSRRSRRWGRFGIPWLFSIDLLGTGRSGRRCCGSPAPKGNNLIAQQGALDGCRPLRTARSPPPSAPKCRWCIGFQPKMMVKVIPCAIGTGGA